MRAHASHAIHQRPEARHLDGAVPGQDRAAPQPAVSRPDVTRGWMPRRCLASAGQPSVARVPAVFISEKPMRTGTMACGACAGRHGARRRGASIHVISPAGPEPGPRRLHEAPAKKTHAKPARARSGLVTGRVAGPLRAVLRVLNPRCRARAPRPAIGQPRPLDRIGGAGVGPAANGGRRRRCAGAKPPGCAGPMDVRAVYLYLVPPFHADAPNCVNASRGRLFPTATSSSSIAATMSAPFAYAPPPPAPVSPRRQRAAQPPTLLTTSLSNAHSLGVGLGAHHGQTPTGTPSLSSPFGLHHPPFPLSPSAASLGSSPMAARSAPGFSAAPYNPLQWARMGNDSPYSSPSVSSAGGHAPHRRQQSRTIAFAPRLVGPDGTVPAWPPPRSAPPSLTPPRRRQSPWRARRRPTPRSGRRSCARSGRSAPSARRPTSCRP
jgi:hypothetical protein